MKVINGMTHFDLICKPDEWKQIEEKAKKARKTNIRFIIDKCLEEPIVTNDVNAYIKKREIDPKKVEREVKKAIKEIQKEDENTVR